VSEAPVAEFVTSASLRKEKVEPLSWDYSYSSPQWSSCFSGFVHY
jgi:hypothetical protein